MFLMLLYFLLFILNIWDHLLYNVIFLVAEWLVWLKPSLDASMRSRGVEQLGINLPQISQLLKRTRYQVLSFLIWVYCFQSSLGAFTEVVSLVLKLNLFSTFWFLLSVIWILIVLLRGFRLLWVQCISLICEWKACSQLFSKVFSHWLGRLSC